MKISACSLDCPDSCSFVVETKNNKITLKGNPEHPVTKGFICAKGKNLLKRINHPDRITNPLLKKNGSFESISWEEAFKLCADKLNSLDPQKILHVRGYGYRGVLADASNVFFRTLGSLETYGSLCDEAGCEAIVKTFGSLEQNDLSELSNADIIINWGKDLSRSSLHTAAYIKDARKKGKLVISISPGGDGNEKFSDKIITIRPGTDRFLAAALIKILLESNEVSPKAIEKCSGLEPFKKLIQGYDLNLLCELCGVELKTARELSNAYISDKKVSSLIGWGVQRYTFGGENISYICSLCALSGQMGQSGTGFYYNISSGRNFSSWAATPETKNDNNVLLQKLESELSKREKKVKFIWIDGVNLANQTPNCESAARTLENCEFVVTVDAFMNDTAMRSDLILPCALTMERDEIIGSALHNYINWSAKVLTPRGSVKSDFEIIRTLATMILEKNLIPEAELCFKKALESSSTPFTFEQLKKKGFAKCDWPSVAYENLNFKSNDEKFTLPIKLSVEESNGKGFNLLSLLRKNYLHSQIPEEYQTGTPELFISPESPYLNDLKEGEEAMLTTKLGSMKIKICFDETIHPDAAIIRRGGWLKHDRSSNKIIEPLITDLGFGTAYYSQKAWLEKI
ncbi:Anaerobic selenocysteine-containing dehydrogenase [Maridesulfovibrio ferrireducens]|uniref:Anaerobic selenocysteine-containing dehydrogenase n=1 Tax=Maridesulfovibrio ferrireducens TaxID=246191 RepID=A0A1G9C5W5_9BACT|nr:molybdopterin-dependent oxidoreductase [Maridesulfovibrio ferrireducens]SDK47059.1 Anaerobic selenocysteine-containing dehydrogenase [Maridesulfovibrio ferrireducens]